MDKHPLMVFCVDGLDPSLAETFGTQLNYNNRLSIPQILYDRGYPKTMHIWPSIFTGEPKRYQNLGRKNRPKWVRKANTVLQKLGIGWYNTNRGRTLKKPTFEEELISNARVMIPEVNHTILDEYYSYDYDVPGVSQTFIFAGSNKLHKARHRHFTTLGLMLYKSNYELVALYTSLIDHLAHIYLDENIIKLKPLYVDIFNYSQNLIKKGLDVMIISDHGCVNGNHTHEAYAGSNHPIEAKNVCELYLEMTSRLVK